MSWWRRKVSGSSLMVNWQTKQMTPKTNMWRWYRSRKEKEKYLTGKSKLKWVQLVALGISDRPCLVIDGWKVVHNMRRKPRTKRKSFYSSIQLSFWLTERFSFSLSMSVEWLPLVSTFVRVSSSTKLHMCICKRYKQEEERKGDETCNSLY